MIYLKAIITYIKLKLKFKPKQKNIWRLDFVIFCFKNNIKIIEENQNSFIVKYKLLTEIVFEIRHYPSSDFAVFKTVIIKKQYDFKLNNVNSIIDAGANVGYTALYFADKFPKSKIICIEPFEKNVSIIKNQIKLNNIKNIFIEEKALWCKDEKLELDFNYRDGREHAVRTLSSNDIFNPNLKDTITLDQIFSKYQINQLDFLKIDIEGSEKEIFELYPLIDDILINTNNLAVEIHDETASRIFIKSKLGEHFPVIYELGELTIASKNE